MKTARIVIACALPVMSIQGADSERGEKLFHTQGCIQCHAIHGRGGREAPDLGRRIGRGYTPALLASTMWNHAPSMWSVMRRQGIERTDLDAQSAADLFAFFSSSRFFDRPGDAARGKRAFSDNRCSECHGIDNVKAAGATPVAKWQGLGDPVALAESMWNHADRMTQEFAARNILWPDLTSQELSDMLVYLRNLPATRRMAVRLQTTSGDRGEALFQSKGCGNCHVGDLNLRSRLQGKTLTDIAASMWNHAPRMERAAIRFEPGEMTEILSYLSSRQLLDDRGNSKRGEKVFAEKRCSACHGTRSGGAPDLISVKGGEYTVLTMISALWRHGPAMLDRMKEKGMLWPRFTAGDMSDLVTFLNGGK
jgi:mono/diheme cytochrome c family protein